MSTYRIFAQLDFERALGNAAIDALEHAVLAKKQFETEPEFGQTGYDREATLAELDQVIEDRLKDVLAGHGFKVIERGERFRSPEIVSLVLAARDRRWTGPS